MAMTYVTAGKIASLEHEIGDHTVELGVLVTVTFAASAEFEEIRSGFGDYIVIKLKVDTAGLICRKSV